MKKLLLALGIASTLVSVQVSAETLRFGMDGGYAPFAAEGTDGKLQGFDVDIANALCASMKVQCQIIPQGWDGLIPSLNTGKFDAILSSMSITDERKKAVDFTDKYYKTPAKMVAKVGTPSNLADFKGKKIGVLRASTQEKFAREHWGKNGASIVAYGKLPEAYLDLTSGRVQGVFADSVMAETTFLKTPNGKGYAFVGESFVEPKTIFGYGAGIAVKKGNDALRNRLNAAIKQIRADGTYKKIEAKYFSFDVYGQ